MIERFEGDNGKRLLAEALADQRIVNGDLETAAKLLEVTQLRELDAADVLITQNAEDNDIYFVIYRQPTRHRFENA